jgi:hypothetical protein
MNPPRILVVRLPCKKVYPIGPIYLMGLLKRAAPQISQRLLDLALVESNQRTTVLRETIRKYSPDVIAFSWRDIQVFSPHDVDMAMRDAFIFFHETSPIRWIEAAFKGLGHILSYHSRIAENLKLIQKAVNVSPSSTIAVGGPSIRVFGERFRSKLSRGVHLFPEANLESFFQLIGLPMPKDPIEPELDLDLLKLPFPNGGCTKERKSIQQNKDVPIIVFTAFMDFWRRKVRRRDPLGWLAIASYYRRWGSISGLPMPNSK